MTEDKIIEEIAEILGYYFDERTLRYNQETDSYEPVEITPKVAKKILDYLKSQGFRQVEKVELKPLGTDSPIIKKITQKYFGTTVANTQIINYLQAQLQSIGEVYKIKED